jgi:predicted nucleic acid-binding protein
MILCDTNIFIEAYRGNPVISAVTNRIGQENILVSDVTRIELLYGAKNKREWLTLHKDLSLVTSLPIDPDISTLSVELVDKYCLSHKLNLPDALIAATAIIHHVELYTLNVKDFVFIPELQLFRP